MSIDIVNLIESNPITKFTGSYQSKLIEKVKNTFNNYEQQMFLSSFYCYLKYDSTKDFVIDLDNVWKWLGFSQKDSAKRVIEKNFYINKDYKIFGPQVGEAKKESRGGHNKEIIMLNIDTFKKFCLKAGTKKADEIHDYFIKLERVLQEILQEESNELKLQLEQKNMEIQNIENEKHNIREKTLLEKFPNNTQCVYYGTIDNLSDKGEKLIKFGNSNNLKNRVKKHNETYLNFRLINVFKVDNKLQIENAIKENQIFIERQRTITVNKKKYVELINIDGISFTELDKIIKEIIVSIEYSPENYIKILEQNTFLKKKLEEKNEINKEHDQLLLKIENNKLMNENVKLLKKYNQLLKRIKKYDINYDVNCEIENLNHNENENEEIKIDDIDNTDNYEIEKYQHIINNALINEYIRNKNGTYTINGKTYKKLIGSRTEVWENITYKTTGDLTKKDLMLNKQGKIVSRRKCIEETINNRFVKYGVNKNNDIIKTNTQHLTLTIGNISGNE